MGSYISFLFFVQLSFLRLLSSKYLLCCGTLECSRLHGWEPLRPWKHLLHDGSVQCWLNVILPVPRVDDPLPFLFLLYFLLCENLIEAHV